MIEAKITIMLQHFLGNIFVDIQAEYRKDRMATEGAYSIWKMLTDGWTDRRTDGGRTARHRISSADYVSSGAKTDFLNTIYWI